jgi:hypothetical protein
MIDRDRQQLFDAAAISRNLRPWLRGCEQTSERASSRRTTSVEMQLALPPGLEARVQRESVRFQVAVHLASR